MSAFNASSHIERAIRSILNQTLGDFEFIIINDGSTDNTADIVNSFTDERIVFIDNQQNQGIPFAVNHGMKIAKGEFIARMDADDEALPEKFKIQIDYLRKHQEIGVLGTATWRISADRTWLYVLPKTHESCFYELLSGSCFLNPSVMMRKSAIGDTLYDERYLFAQDYKFWCDLAKKGVIFANLETPLFKYYRHPTAAGISNIKPQDIYADEIRLDYKNYIFGTDIAAKYHHEIDWMLSKSWSKNAIMTEMALSNLSSFYNAVCQNLTQKKSVIRFLLRLAIIHKLQLVHYRIFDKVAPILLYYYLCSKIKIWTLRIRGKMKIRTRFKSFVAILTINK